MNLRNQHYVRDGESPLVAQERHEIQGISLLLALGNSQCAPGQRWLQPKKVSVPGDIVVGNLAIIFGMERRKRRGPLLDKRPVRQSASNAPP
jgi:hypothetical protein